MGKGRYLKAAERACSRKARFETAASAEAFVERRYRSYRCVVCGGYHLTSGRGDRPEPAEPPKKEPPGPKLGDLDWSAVLDPQPPKPRKKRGSPSTVPSRPPPKETTVQPATRTGVCVGPLRKDGKAMLVVEGKLLKSVSVDKPLRPLIAEGAVVEVEPGNPPRVIRVV